MKKTTIRPVEESDIPRLAEMVAALAQHHGDEPTANVTTLTRDCLGEAPWLNVWVADRDGELCGYAACQRRTQMQFGQRGADLHHLYIAENTRGQGIGSALVAAAQGWARGEQCGYMMVGTEPGNLRAQAFYLGLGFRSSELDGRRFWVALEAR